ncbi:MAG: Rne/Rng family ribonuclease, partial [Planctomycetes bacterium]|nr:Rne/Rng family ribonuclease [Planctomycetota bacterium]
SAPGAGPSPDGRGPDRAPELPPPAEGAPGGVTTPAPLGATPAAGPNGDGAGPSIVSSAPTRAAPAEGGPPRGAAPPASRLATVRARRPAPGARPGTTRLAGSPYSPYGTPALRAGVGAGAGRGGVSRVAPGRPAAPRGRAGAGPSAPAARPRPGAPRPTGRREPPARLAPAPVPPLPPTMEERARAAVRRVEKTRLLTGGRVMLINNAEAEECRIATLDDGRVEEYYVDRVSRQEILHNIYKGRVVNVEPAISAAFVDIGEGRHGFLHVSDVMPSYEVCKDLTKVTTYNMSARPKGTPDIRKLLHRGDDVLVQVSKDEIGKKGPSLTTYLSLPGRFLVLMPGLAKRGVSKRIDDPRDRDTLKRLVDTIQTPDKMGFIVRTAGSGGAVNEVQQDFEHLMKLWEAIIARAARYPAPRAVYLESDLVIRTIRDLFNDGMREIIIDNEEVYERARAFMRELMPGKEDRLRLYQEDIPLFSRFAVEAQLESFYERRVPLASGAFLVIDQTEAMVAIDVNSGRNVREKDPEKLAFSVNAEAVPEIARQLRVRDLGGLVVIDFIDMQDRGHIREVTGMLHEEFKKDRSRFNISEMSEFGLVQITRQRFRGGLERLNFQECSHCKGNGIVRTVESEALNVLRRVRLGLAGVGVSEVRVTTQNAVAAYLGNGKRRELLAMEDRFAKRLVIIAAGEVFPETQILFLDDQGRPVTVEG